MRIESVSDRFITAMVSVASLNRYWYCGCVASDCRQGLIILRKPRHGAQVSSGLRLFEVDGNKMLAMLDTPWEL